MTELRIEAMRGDLVESVHRVSAALVHADGRLVAGAGDTSRVAYWRSAAKPIQAMPLVEDGVADRYDFMPVRHHAARAIVNTRGALVGTIRATGGLRFYG